MQKPNKYNKFNEVCMLTKKIKFLNCFKLTTHDTAHVVESVVITKKLMFKNLIQ